MPDDQQKTDRDNPIQAEPLWDPGMDREYVAAEVRKKRNKAVGYLITNASKQTLALLADCLAPAGVSPAQWQVFVVLWEKDGIVQRDLAEHMAIEQATLTRTLDRMERDGFVERKRDENDRRRIRVFVTEMGFGLINTLVPKAMKVQETITKGFSDEELDLFRSFLRRLIGNTNADHPLAEKNYQAPGEHLEKGAAQ